MFEEKQEVQWLTGPWMVLCLLEMAVDVERQNERLPPCLRISVRSLEYSSVVSIMAALHEVPHSLLSSCFA